MIQAGLRLLQVLLLLHAPQCSTASTNVVVGKSASVNGSVMVTQYRPPPPPENGPLPFPQNSEDGAGTVAFGSAFAALKGVVILLLVLSIYVYGAPMLSLCGKADRSGDLSEKLLDIESTHDPYPAKKTDQRSWASTASTDVPDDSPYPAKKEVHVAVLLL
jgi:hypothetical protein